MAKMICDVSGHRHACLNLERDHVIVADNEFVDLELVTGCVSRQNEASLPTFASMLLPFFQTHTHKSSSLPLHMNEIILSHDQR